MMRISTAGMYESAVNGMLRQQASVSRTQEQVASGKRVNSAADDPVAAVQLQDLARIQAQLEQYGKNAVSVTTRLQQEEQSLADATTTLERVRELVLQANNATLTDADRQSVLTELRSRVSELQALANRRDSNGDYLFSGNSADLVPFQRDSAGVMQYAGDTGSRTVQVDAAVGVQDSDNGARVFVDIPAGNGVFTTVAAAGNTGTGVIDAGAVTQPSAWVSDRYTISFAAADAWQVTDSGGNVVASGSYSSDSAISFRGIQVHISGTPASGDSFVVDQAATMDVFTMLDQLVAALDQPVGNEAAFAQLNNALNGSLQQIDQAMEHFTGVRAEVGARLGLLDDVQATHDSQSTAIATAVSKLRDLDYAEAVSRLNQQSVGLQAAQQSYAKIAQLSLFNYL
jgi:flagellar hook-associated protein 3 FlgL